jgi:HEAT repeat protein
MVLFGPPDLDKLKAKGNIKGLIKALHYGTNEKHQYIAELSKKYLGDIGEPAVEPLIEALNDKGWFTNKAAAEILGIIGDKRAIVPLSNTLNHKNQVVSTAALGALANFGTNAFIPLIEVLISDGAEDLKVEASEALMWIFPQHS